MLLMQVVEIVDRYDVACVPEHMQDDKLAYIKNVLVDKTCTRILKVGPRELVQNPQNVLTILGRCSYLFGFFRS